MTLDISESETYDVVVLGSGAAALTAAFTAANEGASVALFEKNSRLGGTSAWSGGHVWVAANPYMAEHGLDDDVEQGFEYLMAIGRGQVDADLIRAVADGGPRMLSYLEQHGGIPFYAVPGLPDYHPELPGGKTEGGRTVGTPLFPYGELGDWGDRVEVTPYYSPWIVMDETPIGSGRPKPPSAEEVERRRSNDERGSGASLVGYLLRASLAAGVHAEVSTPAVDLVVKDGRAVAVVVDGPKGRRTIRARHGIIFGTGGFEWNDELVRTFLRGWIRQPASIPTNTGDALELFLKVGVRLQNMTQAWWTPITVLPEGVNSMNLDMINNDRTRPGSIMVNREGKRFANEAANYNALGGAFHQEDPAAYAYLNIPAWIIHDHGYLERFGSRGTPWSGTPPVWLVRAPTLEALAEDLDIPADALVATVARWNAAVANGRDGDFHRGDSAHDRWWGDPWNKGTVEATLGRVGDHPPFYAMKLEPGVLGTKGGPKTDVHGRVIALDGTAIEGLYAVGNTSSPLGPGYPGPGGTHGPNMTFGWIAGLHAAGAAE